VVVVGGSDQLDAPTFTPDGSFMTAREQFDISGTAAPALSGGPCYYVSSIFRTITRRVSGVRCALSIADYRVNSFGSVSIPLRRAGVLSDGGRAIVHSDAEGTFIALDAATGNRCGTFRRAVGVFVA